MFTMRFVKINFVSIIIYCDYQQAAHGQRRLVGRMAMAEHPVVWIHTCQTTSYNCIRWYVSVFSLWPAESTGSCRVRPSTTCTWCLSACVGCSTLTTSTDDSALASTTKSDISSRHTIDTALLLHCRSPTCWRGPCFPTNLASTTCQWYCYVSQSVTNYSRAICFSWNKNSVVFGVVCLHWYWTVGTVLLFSSNIVCAVMIVRRISGKIIRIVLCCTVHNSYVRS